MSKVSVSDTCWNWIGGKSNTGYGSFFINGKSIGAHRASYLIFKGSIYDLWVLHTCDNKRCVNPNHLYLGDHTQNTKDAVDRNRMAKGDNHPSKLYGTESYSGDNSKLTAIKSDDALTLSNSVLNGEKVESIANSLNLNKATIYRAISKISNRKLPLNNSSGIKGLFYDKSRNTWIVSTQKNKSRIRKSFKTKSEAEIFLNSMLKARKEVKP